MTNGLYDELRNSFSESLDQDWLILPNRANITYGDLDRATARVVSVLNRLGIQPGDRVCVQAGKSPENLITYLGVVRSGAVYLPLNPDYGPDEVSYFLGNARPSLVIGGDKDRGWIEAVAADSGIDRVEILTDEGGGSWAELISSAEEAECFPPVESQDLAALLYTSGTTGRSKGAMITHENLISNAWALSDAWGFNTEDVLLHSLPVFHVHGLFVALHPPMLHANSIRLHSRFDPDAVIEDMAKSTVFMGVPTMYNRLLDKPGFTRSATNGMRLLTSGSAPLPADTYEEIVERSGVAVVERYGMTETQIITSNVFGKESHAGSVGWALTGVEIRVVDDSLVSVTTGEVAQVQVRGPGVCRGYWEMPDKTAEEVTSDGWFRTGDLGYLSDDDRLFLVGRNKDLIITGGLNVYPIEVEARLNEFNGIVESAVVAAPDPDFGEAVVGFVVCDDVGLDLDSVLVQMKSSMASFKVPKRLVRIESLPRNSMGKVQKSELRRSMADPAG